MKKFDVYVWQTFVRSYTKTVEAEDPDDAKYMVWDLIESGELNGYEKHRDSDTSVYEVKE